MEQGGEHISHWAQNQVTMNKINQSSKGYEKENIASVAYTWRLGAQLVNNNWTGLFMSTSLSAVTLQRFDQVICATEMSKSHLVIHLGKKEWKMTSH